MRRAKPGSDLQRSTEYRRRQLQVDEDAQGLQIHIEEDLQLAVKQTGQVREANFFSGEWALRNGAKDEAWRLCLLAAGDCAKRFIQWRRRT